MWVSFANTIISFYLLEVCEHNYVVMLRCTLPPPSKALVLAALKGGFDRCIGECPLLCEVSEWQEWHRISSIQSDLSKGLMPYLFPSTPTITPCLWRYMFRNVSYCFVTYVVDDCMHLCQWYYKNSKILHNPTMKYGCWGLYSGIVAIACNSSRLLWGCIRFKNIQKLLLSSWLADTAKNFKPSGGTSLPFCAVAQHLLFLQEGFWSWVSLLVNFCWITTRSWIRSV